MLKSWFNPEDDFRFGSSATGLYKSCMMLIQKRILLSHWWRRRDIKKIEEQEQSKQRITIFISKHFLLRFSDACGRKRRERGGRDEVTVLSRRRNSFHWPFTCAYTRWYGSKNRRCIQRRFRHTDKRMSMCVTPWLRQPTWPLPIDFDISYFIGMSLDN